MVVLSPFLSAGIHDSPMAPIPSAAIFKSVAPVTEFIGPTLTRISALKASCSANVHRRARVLSNGGYNVAERSNKMPLDVASAPTLRQGFCCGRSHADKIFRRLFFPSELQLLQTEHRLFIKRSGATVCPCCTIYSGSTRFGKFRGTSVFPGIASLESLLSSLGA